MLTIQTLNKISVEGLNLFPRDQYEIATEIPSPDAILLRSQNLHGVDLPESVKAIARAGAGVNNIPIDLCSERGIVVFNTPGANANSVKELVLAGLLLSSRRISEGISWVRTLKDEGERVPVLVEGEKKAFAGPEIAGKTLGVIGLGAIGASVANTARALGMDVIGHDPFITVEGAWELSSDVRRAVNLTALIAESDYITLHTPLTDDTRGLIDDRLISHMKPGARILNFARKELVDHEALFRAFASGQVAAYVTDFPTADLLAYDQVIPVPHLGASTPEAEANCAVMAVRQLRAFLEDGNIVNSVNFPTCQLPRSAGRRRLVITNRNIPKMVGRITTILADGGVNIADMINKGRGELAYNIIDLDSAIDASVISRLEAVEGVINVRYLN